MKRIIVLLLSLLLSITSVLSIAKASDNIPPLNRDDFNIAITGKFKVKLEDRILIREATVPFSILTGKLSLLEKLTRNKFVRQKKQRFFVELATKEATFYGAGLGKSLSKYVYKVCLAKDGETARGIKIGSTVDELLAAYRFYDDRNYLNEYICDDSASDIWIRDDGFTSEWNYDLTFLIDQKTRTVKAIEYEAQPIPGMFED